MSVLHSESGDAHDSGSRATPPEGTGPAGHPDEPRADTLPLPSPAREAGRPEPPVHLLDRRRIALERTVNSLSGAAIAFAHLVALLVLWVTNAWSAWALSLLALAWPAVFAFLLWFAIGWPAIDYRHWRYRVDHEGIEIWSGVIWRQTVTVPRSRVQHIDVAQGPLERSYGLATLSIYTAGTRYSKVDLPGLDHGVALGLRDALLPKDAEPAV